VLIEGLDFETTPREDFADLKALAGELAAEVWLSVSYSKEQIVQLPGSVEHIEDLVSVALALEPGDDAVLLRALKDHDNPDLTDLHVALDPKTLLLTRH
jgi:hypothetical protein